MRYTLRSHEIKLTDIAELTPAMLIRQWLKDRGFSDSIEPISSQVEIIAENIGKSGPNVDVNDV